MHPVLWQFGSYVIGTHNTLIGLAVCCAAVVFYKECRRRGLWSEQMLWVAAGALIGGAIGAKASSVFGLIASGPQPGLGVVLVHGGRSIVGGITGGYLGVLATKRLVGYRRRTGDCFAPAIALAGAVGRWGCFFAEMPGTPTTMPWGIRLTPEQVARIPECPAYCRTSALHPSMIYEIMFQSAMFLILWRWARWRPSLRDRLLDLYLAAYAVFRFFVEFVRGHDQFWLGLSRAQCYLALVVIGFGMYFMRNPIRLRPEAIPGSLRPVEDA